MKIYVVTSGEYSEYGIDSVFIDKHKAEIYCAENNKSEYGYNDYRIEEYESEDENIEGDLEIAWRYEINDDDRRAWGIIVPYTHKCLNEVKRNKYRLSHLKAIVYLRKESNSKALKIARDMFAQYKAEQEGI